MPDSDLHTFQAPIEGNPKDDLQAQADAMDKKAAAPNTDTKPVDPNRPTWLPEKFKTPEDLAKSYLELEQKFSQGNQQKKEDTPPATPDDKKVDKFDFNPIFEEALKNGGKISDETYKALDAKGISRDVADFAIKGALKEAADEQRTITERAGGKDQFDVLTKWAAAALNPAEIEAFNRVVYDGTVEEACLAVDGLKARYENSNGKIPNLVKGDGSGSSTGGYESRAQMTTDMRDPRYQKDPAFRKQVEEKIKASTIF